jgi:hypothetical protein
MDHSSEEVGEVVEHARLFRLLWLTIFLIGLPSRKEVESVLSWRGGLLDRDLWIVYWLRMWHELCFSGSSEF